jgi:hypothetical protein
VGGTPRYGDAVSAGGQLGLACFGAGAGRVVDVCAFFFAILFSLSLWRFLWFWLLVFGAFAILEPENGWIGGSGCGLSLAEFFWLFVGELGSCGDLGWEMFVMLNMLMLIFFAMAVVTL